jgi:hypothetical protein
VNPSTFEIAINSAVLHYNGGADGVIAVLNNFALTSKATIE